MDGSVKEYLERYSDEIRALYGRLRQLVLEAAQPEPEERMWAKLPSYCVNDSFVRLIPFRDHINVQAKAIPDHREELAGYRITPKGMLQIGLKQELSEAPLKRILAETFAG